MAGAYGFATQLGISANNPVDVRYDFQSESLAMVEDFVDTGGLRGTRSHVIERVRAGNQHIGGALVLQPSAVELAALLPWILGANASGTTFALADTLQSRYVTVDRVLKVFTYAGCLVDSATFRAMQGGPLSLTLALVASTETVGDAASFPSLSIDTSTNAFMLTDTSTLTISGTTVTLKDFELTIANHVDRDRFFNSQTLSTGTRAMDRTITFRTMLPYGDFSALYNTGSSGVAGNIVLTNGAVSLQFSLVKLAIPRRSPTVQGRQEIMMPVEAVAYRSGSTLELVCTLDSTP